MAFKMKGSQFYGKLKLNRNMDDSSQPDGRAKSSAFQKAKCFPGSTDPECGNFKVKKKGTVVSRALNKAGKWVKGELDDAVSNIKKGNKKRKKKRNTVKAKGSLPRTLDTNPNFVNDYNKETRPKEVLDKIAKHEY